MNDETMQRKIGRFKIGAFLLALMPGVVRANPGAQPRQAAPAWAVEAHTCAPCHAAEVRSFAENPHAQPVSTREARGITCATCHGSQNTHAANHGSTSGMNDSASANSPETDAMCLGCHSGKHGLYEHSAHGTSSVRCTSCHKVHAARVPDHLLKVAGAELCYQCHAEVRAQFSMSYGHPLTNGLMQCTDCHDPHGMPGGEGARSSKRQDTFCADCHTAAAGPFRFEHPVMRTEGCTACHVSHGGAYPHLLLRASVDALCQQCHIPAPDPATGAHAQRAKNDTAPSKSCTDCHADVHGSDRSASFLREP